MGNKSGKQKISKKSKNDEQPNDNENKPEEKPENGPTTATDKAEDKTVDQTGDDSAKVDKEGDGGGGATDETGDKKPETENIDNTGDEAAKEVTKETENTDKEQPSDQQGDSNVVPKETEPSDNIVKDNVETETPQNPGDTVMDKVENETPPPDSGDVTKDKSADEVVVDDSSSKENETPVTNGDHETEIPSTDGETKVGDDMVESTKVEEVVPNGEPKEVQIEVTPPVSDEAETNGNEDDKPQTTDQDLEKQDEPPTEHPTELTETKYEVEFKWEDEGENVLVSGTFNEWKEKIPLEKSDDVFTAKMELPAGEYLYKYFVDDEWVINKNQPTKPDEEGTENNVLVVESAG